MERTRGLSLSGEEGPSVSPWSVVLETGPEGSSEEGATIHDLPLAPVSL